MSTTDTAAADSPNLVVLNDGLFRSGVHWLLAGPSFKTADDVRTSLDAGWAVIVDDGQTVELTPAEVDLLTRCLVWHAARRPLSDGARFVARRISATAF